MHSEMLEESGKVSISEFDDNGFVINDVYLKGSVLVFPHTALMWKPSQFEDVTEDSLALVGLTNPETEILLVGCGERIKHNIDQSIREYYMKRGIVIELMDSANACATFNILNAEGRQVAAAMLPS